MDFLRELAEIWPYLAVAITLAMAAIASGHAILHKRDARTAVLWVGFIWFAPVVGPVLYVLFGINRIQRHAVSLWRGHEFVQSGTGFQSSSTRRLSDHLTNEGEHLTDLSKLVNSVTKRPLIGGNRLVPFTNGDRAIPEMLRTIDDAKRTINLITYIFDRDIAGKRFVDRLAAAVKRGVEVRVLVDDTGARYSFPGIVGLLRRSGVPTERFLPTLNPWQMMGINLRNHRKILVVDGVVGFTGGMNIRAGNLLKESPKRPIQDIHFRVEGPVVGQMQEAFADDWQFTTREIISGEAQFPRLKPSGNIFARAISDGPDGEHRKLRWIFIGALNAARRRVRIVTPYFLPDEALVLALTQAARRGVEVDIVLPGQNNLPFVQWASAAGLWQVLMHNVRVWHTPPPFDHTKLMVVDGTWTLIGSTNWDPRSLRLNFEFNIECYDSNFASQIEEIVDSKIGQAKRFTLEMADARNVLIRLRDGVARLFTPFL